MGRFARVLSLAVLPVLAFSSLAAGNCTLGFWKTHPETWCETTLQLGDVNYVQEELLAILNLPVEGNGLVSLAHQLIAAKLNVACGSDPVSEIDDADVLIGSLVVPPVGSGFLDPAVTSSLIMALDAFNNAPGDPGGFGGCAPISIEDFSWGRVKAVYR